MPKKTAKKTTKAAPKKKVEQSRTVKQELQRDDFRIAIFGSARLKKSDKTYKEIFELAKMIGEEGMDIVTGGGPGLMEAANAGHSAGDPDGKADSIGLTIQLPWEGELNKFVEIQKHFNKFSGRLDHFMALSSAVVITPGGVGTCLEFFYTWQLIQVQHICPIPVILVGKMWEELMKWVKKYPIKDGLISPKDADTIHIAKNNKDAMKLIMKTREIWKKEGKNYCKNVNKYKLNGKV